MGRQLPEKMKATQFKKGVSGNPKGRLPLTKEQRAMRELTLDSLRNVIKASLTGNVDDLKEIATNPETSALEVGFATAVLKAIKSGDPAVLERFAERIVGKIPDDIRITATADIKLTALAASTTDDELKKRLLKIRSDV